jgi:hypothetical protein
MLLLVLVALAVPAVSLAGGSAGDQQYTDPFSGGSSGSGSHTAGTTTSSPATTTSSPAPAQTTPSAAPSTTPADPTTAAAVPTTAGDPTATAAAVPTTAGEPTATMAGGSSTTLPHTGYDAWTAVGFGVALVAGGAALRWHLRARRT